MTDSCSPPQRAQTVTDKTLAIGCFGSVVALSPASATCSKCELLSLCQEKVFQNEPVALAALRKLEQRALADSGYRLSSDDMDLTRSPEIETFWKRRKNKLKPVKRKPAAKTDAARLDAIKASGLDLNDIRAGHNPFRAEPDGTYEYFRLAIDFILRAKVFTAKDIADEYFRHGETYKVLGTRRRYAQRVIRTLIDAQLVELAPDERSIYCLRP